MIKEKFIRKVKILTGGVNGVASQAEIVRAFGVSKISVKRYVKCYRKVGSNGFFSPRRTRSAAVLTPEVLREVQKLLDAGEEVSRICQEIGLKTDTVNKAIRDGRLQREVKKRCHIHYSPAFLRRCTSPIVLPALPTINTLERIGPRKKL